MVFQIKGHPRWEKPQNIYRQFKRDEVPLNKNTPPLLLKGEGDTGGEVDTNHETNTLPATNHINGHNALPSTTGTVTILA